MDESTTPLPPPTFSTFQLISYLQHINYPNSHNPNFTLSDLPPANYDLLCQLMWLQLATVPFENMEMQYGDGKVTLELGALWEKVIGRKRGPDGTKKGFGGMGGYCMQVNQLFMALLRGVGFQGVWGIGARISTAVTTNGADPSGSFTGWSHMVLIVPLPAGSSEQLYLVDVGYGGNNITRPLPLIHGQVVPGIDPQSYRLLHKPLRQNQNQRYKWWVLQVQNASGAAEGDGTWWDAYAFNPEMEFIESDFDVMSWGVSSRGGSVFSDWVLCCKVLLDVEQGDGGGVERVKGIKGRLILMGDKVKERLAGGKANVLEELQTEEQRVAALERYFGIVLTQKEKEGIRGKKAEIKMRVHN